MQNKKRKAFLPIIFACGLIFSSCNTTPQETKYTVTWKNFDGTVLEQDKDLEKGAMPTYDGLTPTRAADAQYSYEFEGWSPAVVEVDGNATYTAQFKTTVKTYTVTWKNYNGVVLEEDYNVAYGTRPTYDGADPVKPDNAQYSYQFEGWEPAISEVKGNATYTAKFTETVKSYNITWKNEDGTVLATTKVPYGQVPAYEGTTPTKVGDVQYTYTFSGWSPKLVAVKGDATYTAQYTKSVNKYTITWKNDDGSVLASGKVAYGTLPTYSGATPTKEGNVQYSYKFAGWTPNVVVVSGDATYTATYTSSINSYVITWKNDDGSVLGMNSVPYGQVPAYEGKEPQKAATAQYTYKFDGWDKELVPVTGDATYTAKYSSTINQYTITWKNADGAVLDTKVVDYGTVPLYEGDDPKMAGDEQSPQYRFIGWDRDPEEPIVGDTTITAVYRSYLKEVVVEDFEEFESNADLADAGWVALGYNNGWTTDTKATVSLGTRSEEGKKSIRFDAWENGNGYKIAGPIDKKAFGDKAVNALRFRLMTPEINTVKVILYMETIEYQGSQQTPSFTYNLGKPTSSEFVEYTIPLDDDNWDLWGMGQGISIAKASSMFGVHQDDVPQMLTKIEFFMQGNDGNGWVYVAFLDSVRFVTEDNPVLDKKETMQLYDRYTGINTEGYTVRIDVEETGEAVATLVDLKVPQQIPGNVEIDDNHIVTFTSADDGQSLVYKGKLHNAGKDIKFVSAEGTMAQFVEEMKLNAVQVVNNFDQYTSDGKSYYQGNKDVNNRSGFRGDVYSEYYSGGTTTGTWANGWNLMGGDGSQAKLKTDGGHSGKQYACLKNSGDNAMRYMTWGLFDGTAEQRSFRGTKLSFWVRTNGRVPSFKAYMWSRSAPTPQNLSEGVGHKVKEFKQTSQITNWTHFEVALDSRLVYYGFMFFMEKSGYGTDSYLYIDDIEIYTANPYETYQAPVQPEEDKLEAHSTYMAKINGLFNATVEIVDDQQAKISVPGLGLSANGTYGYKDGEVTLNFAAAGLTYVATVDSAHSKLTFKSAEGAMAAYFTNLNFNRVDVIEHAENYASAGKMYYQGNKDDSNVSGARGAYYCDYYTGNTNDYSPLGGQKWNLMGGNGDQLDLAKTGGVNGSQYLKMKMSTAGKMRYMTWGLYNGTAQAHSNVNRFSIYLKNDNDFAMNNIHVRVYYVQQVNKWNVGSSRTDNTFSLTAKQGWTKFTINLDSSKTYYGYCIYFDSQAKTGYMGVDNAHFYNVDSDPELSFYTYDTETLEGTITAGKASIVFGANGAVKFSCANLGMENVACTYVQAMNGADQVMTITVPVSASASAKITGVYSITQTGIIAFTVTAVDAALASYVNVGAVLSNAK